MITIYGLVGLSLLVVFLKLRGYFLWRKVSLSEQDSEQRSLDEKHAQNGTVFSSRRSTDNKNLIDKYAHLRHIQIEKVAVEIIVPLITIASAIIAVLN